MKKLLKNICWFFMPVLVLAIIAEYLLQHMPNEYRLKNNLLTQNAAGIKVLCLGSSHSYYNVNPAYFSLKAFNAAHSSQTLDYDWFLLKKYDKQFDSLQYILLPVSYFTFYEKLETGAEAWRIKNYILYYHIYETGYLPYYSELLSTPPKKNIHRLVNYYINNNYPIPVNPFGYASGYSSQVKNDLEVLGKSAAIRNTYHNKDHFNENIQYLQKIIKWADERNIKVLLFTSPAYESYRNHLNITQLNETYKTIMDFKLKNRNVFYKDFMADSSFIRSDFYDGDHLNEIGAKKFSLLLNDLIQTFK